VPNFGAAQLASWANRKFGTSFDASILDGVSEPRAAAETLTQKAREVYRQRELSYSIDYAIQMTNAELERDRAGALTRFCAFVNGRYGVSWTPESLPARDVAEGQTVLLTLRALDRGPHDMTHQEDQQR
jgi:hypothetical protein